jgi:hypothetical protein
MHRLAIPVVALLTVAASTDFAVARDGCGRGFYFDGYRCAPMGRYSRDYGYGQGYGYGGYAGGYYGRGYGIDRRTPCGPGWSVQDGVCKPYRGY